MLEKEEDSVREQASRVWLGYGGWGRKPSSSSDMFVPGLPVYRVLLTLFLQAFIYSCPAAPGRAVYVAVYPRAVYPSPFTVCIPGGKHLGRMCLLWGDTFVCLFFVIKKKTKPKTTEQKRLLKLFPGDIQHF